jgi:dihydrofolate reductase
MEIVLIAAMDQHRAIGYNNQLPWHLPDDLRFFKEKTQGGIVVMGRKTYESLGRPLPNRRNIVLTRQTDWQAKGAEVAHDWQQLKQSCEAAGIGKLWIIGGAEIYALTLNDATQMFITHVDTTLTQADAFFPEWSSWGWLDKTIDRHEADEKHTYAFKHVHYLATTC